MKTNEEIIELVNRASKGDRNAVDEIHKMDFEERVRMFKLITEGKV
jgi:hypothetical protein